MAAGVVTTTEERLGNVQKITFAWTAGTAPTAGTATGTTTYLYTGVLLRAVTVPDAVSAPTDDYDITITDGDGVDVAAGLLANRDTANTEWVTSGLGAVVGDTLTINLSAAGSATKGVCILYIGLMPEMANPVTELADALYGTTGIATFPAPAAAANNVSLAEVIRYIQASQIGALANSGGTATLAGILGDPANVALATSIAKIATASAGGLTATADSLAYNIAEIERHFHSYERWFGKAITPTATHFADRIGRTESGGAEVAFQLDGANDDWGTWTQLFGPDDTPAVAGGVKFDIHRLMIVDAERDGSTHYIQIGVGASGAAALAANTYTEIVYRPQATNTEETPILVQMRRAAADALIWARVFVVGQNTGTVDFFVGLHEYEG